MSTHPQGGKPRPETEAFKQIAKRFASPHGLDDLYRLSLLPDLLEIQLPLVAFNPFATAALESGGAPATETWSVHAETPRGIGPLPGMPQPGDRPRPVDPGRVDPAGQAKALHHLRANPTPPAGPEVSSQKRREDHDARSGIPSIKPVKMAGEKSETADPPQPTAASERKKGAGGTVEQKPSFGSPSNGSVHPMPAHPIKDVAPPGPNAMLSTAAPSTDIRAPLIAALRQLDAVTQALLSIPQQSQAGNDASTPIASPRPGTTEARPSHMDTEAWSRRGQRPPLPAVAGRDGLPGPASPSAASGSSGPLPAIPQGKTIYGTKDPLTPPAAGATVHDSRAAGENRASICKSITLLDQLTAAPRVGVTPLPLVHEAPNTRWTAPASASGGMAPSQGPGVTASGRPKSAPTAPGPTIDPLALVAEQDLVRPGQGPDPRQAAEQLTDLINDVLVAQARRHGVDV